MLWTTAVAALRARFPSLARVGSSTAPLGRVRRALRTIATGVVATLLLGMDGCPDQWVRQEDPLELSVSRALRGAAPTVTNFTITWSTTGAEGAPEFDVTTSPDETARIGLAPRPHGVSMAVGTPSGDRFPVTLTVAPDAPLGPVFFRASRLKRRELGYIYEYAVSDPFQIYTGTVPRAGGPQPYQARRGASLDVAFDNATGIDEPVTVIPGDPGIEVVAASYDPANSRVNASLRIRRTAHTGDTWMVLQTGSGNRTERLGFRVTSDVVPATVTGMYPNRFSSPESVPVWLAGTEFTPGTTVERSDVETHAVPGQVNVVDSRLLRFVMTVGFPNAGSISLSARAAGGPSNSVPFSYGDDAGPDRGIHRPRITRVTPGRVTAGVPVDLRIEGTDLDYADASTIEVVGLPSDFVDVPFTDATVLPGGGPSVVNVRVTPSIQSGAIRIALRYAGEFSSQDVHTEALGMTIVDAPAPPAASCADIPAAGADLTVSGRAPIRRATSPAAGYNLSGHATVAVYSDDESGSLLLEIPKYLFEITTGTNAATYLTYTSGESQWIKNVGATVEVVATEPTLKLCIDATLPRDGAGPPVTVRGYVVVTR